MRIELGILLNEGVISITQEMELYLVSFTKACVFKGLGRDVPDGYRNFAINGIEPDGDVLKIRMKIG
jgi:hypothetical protein